MRFFHCAQRTCLLVDGHQRILRFTNNLKTPPTEDTRQNKFRNHVHRTRKMSTVVVVQFPAKLVTLSTPCLTHARLAAVWKILWNALPKSHCASVSIVVQAPSDCRMDFHTTLVPLTCSTIACIRHKCQAKDYRTSLQARNHQTLTSESKTMIRLSKQESHSHEAGEWANDTWASKVMGGNTRRPKLCMRICSARPSGHVSLRQNKA